MKKEIILSYSFFLVWLLSFLYNGPILFYAFRQTSIDIRYLAMTYIFVPAVVCFGVCFFYKKHHNAILFMKYSIMMCMVGTLILIFFTDKINAVVTYSIGAILGVSSIIFIAGWGILFTYHIHFIDMIKIMGLTICLGKVIFSINQVLCSYDLEEISIIVIFASLAFTYCTVQKVGKILRSIEYEKKAAVPFDINLVSILCFTMFFVNVGGGVCKTLFFSRIKQGFINIFFLDIIIYIVIFIVLIFINNFKEENFIMIFSLTLLGTGFLMFIIFIDNPVPSYVLTLIAYLFIDIILWTTTGKVGRMFCKPIPVFFSVMGANLFAVFIGNLLGVFLNKTLKDIYISISIPVISILLAFSFASILYKRLNKVIKHFERINFSVPDLDIFTDKEKLIIHGMLQGLKNKEIADQVNITENTFKTHARNIYTKAKVKNKKELIGLYKKGELFCQRVSM